MYRARVKCMASFGCVNPHPVSLSPDHEGDFMQPLSLWYSGKFVNPLFGTFRALLCRIPLLAVSLASICMGSLKLGDCVDEPWIPVGVAVHGVLMLLDVALAAAALLAVASSCAGAAVKRALFALTVCNWVVFVAW